MKARLERYWQATLHWLTGWKRTGTWAVLAEAWVVQNEAGRPLDRTENEREFLPPVLEVQDRPASRIGLRAAKVILIAMFIGFLWAAFSPRPIHVVMQGKIVPSGRVQVIEPLEPATVKAVHVKNGDVVKSGQVLLHFDPTEIQADKGRLKRELETAKADAIRLTATLKALTQNLAPEKDLFTASNSVDRARQQAFMDATLSARNAREAALSSDAMRYTEQIDKLTKVLVEREKAAQAGREKLAPLAKLHADNHISLSDLLLAKQETAAAEAAFIETRGSLREAKEALKGIEQKRLENQESTLEQVHRELAEAQTRQRSAAQELTKAEQREARSRLLAPVDGVVANLAVHTVGDVVQTGERLMIIVPMDAGLEIEALLKNRDRGDAWAEQEARIKIEAFPFTKYGVIPGEIVHISPDAIEVENQGLMFPVRVQLNKSHLKVRGKQVPLGAGMSVTVEARAGSQTVLQYLVTPLARIADEALREK